MKTHEEFMKVALDEALKAYQINEVPIGAIVVCDGEIIAKAHNHKESTQKVTAHAEILAIEKANEKLKSWRLDSCTLYVTIEPCPMCAGAIIQSRIKEVVYGSQDIKGGAHQSVVNIFENAFNHRVVVTPNVLKTECKNIIQKFFKELRK